MKPRKFAIAKCGMGFLGLILSDAPRPVEYGSGYQMAWTGIHLSNDGKVGYGMDWHQAEFGAPWCSRNPTILGYLNEIKDLPIHIREELASLV